MKKFIRWFKNYMRETYKNKIVALLLIVLSWWSVSIDSDATGFVWMLCLAVPLFFTTKDYILDRRDKP